MELTLTGASLSSDAASSSNARNSKNNVNLNSDMNTHMKVANTKSCQAKSCQDSAAQVNASAQVHAHSHKSCCAHKHQPQQDYKQLEMIPIEKLTARPDDLFKAIIGIIRNGPFDTFRYLADAVLHYEKEKGVALDWGSKIQHDDTDSSLLNRSAEGYTLTHWAAKREDDIQFIEYLSKVTNANLHVPSTDQVGMYPIHWAATEGSIPIVAYILKHSNSTSGYATTSSSSAHHHHHPKSLNHHNIDPNDPINARDKMNCTPLLIAAQYGHADLSAFLIKRGADPNAVDDSADTALHWAAYKGTVPVCGLLLHLNGIENHLDIQDVFGQTPIHLASLRGNVDVVQYLMDQAEGYAERNMDGMSVDLSLTATTAGNNNTTGLGSTSSSTVAPGSFTTNTIDQFPRRLLTCSDKDGKTPLDLAVKKKKIACQVVLREYMDTHCNTDRSLWGKIKQNVKPFCSCTNWKTWIGITPDHGTVKKSPRLVFWFVLFNLNLAVLVELLIYAPLSFKHGFNGRLADSAYLPLHITTIFFIMVTYASLITVNRTDPGVLSVTGFTASNAAPTSYCGAFLSSIMGAIGSAGAILCGIAGGGGSREHSILCANENGRIKREMQNLTRELRDEYEETLEQFATEDQLKKDNSPSVPPSLCHSCHIAKPLRSKHCRVLNQCVLLFDHHCPFVGTTVGLYNYRYFYLFVFSMTVAEILLGITGILYLRHPSDGGDGRTEYKMIFLALYIAFFGLLSGGLCIYHTQLISRNLTTNEHANIHRFRYLSYDPSTGAFSNPFDKGFIQNFIGRFTPWKGSYMLAYCNVVCREEMENNNSCNVKRNGREPKKDEDETEDLMLNVV